MNVPIVRKLVTGEKEQARFFELAAQGGFNVIELLWSKFSASPKQTTGFESPKEITSGVQSLEVDTAGRIVTVVTWTEFRPDTDSRCWAYVIDTPHNRKVLARSLKTGWYKINDAKVLQEVKELAIKLELPTEKVAKPVTNIKRTAREKAAESKVDQLSNEIAKLKRMLAEKEDAKQLFDKMTKKVDAEQATVPEVKQEEPKPERPPLKGVHIDREKIGK